MNLVYQYYRDHKKEKRENDNVGSYLQMGYDYWDYSEKSIKAYAKKIKCDYKFLDQPLKDNLSPFFGIFIPFVEGWCHDYDAICFIDSDIMATTKAKDIFKTASKESISAHLLRRSYGWKDEDYSWFREIGGQFNSGTVVFPRAVYNDLIKFCKTLKSRHANRSAMAGRIGGLDQAQVNFFMREQNSYHKLDKEFNYHLTDYRHENRWDASLIHYHRKHKHMMKEEFRDNRILK